MKTIIFPVVMLSMFFFACSSDLAKVLNDDMGGADDILNGDEVNIPDGDTGSDGPIKDDGPLTNDDGQVVNDDGQVVNDDGQIINDDGQIINDDGQVVNDDGQVVNDDGQIVNDDGEVVNDEEGNDGFWPDEEDLDDTQPDEAQPDTDTEMPDDDVPQICTPLEIVDCPYSGDPLTEDVGPCKAGTKQCNVNGTAWSDCSGEVIPAEDDPCTDSIDNDCNGTMNDGYDDGATGCACMPATNSSCYTGPSGTLNVGICHAGTMTCNAQGTGYGSCVNEQTPLTTDICGNGLNDDCDAQTDESIDADGDGYGTCGGDCCDNTSQCADPAKVNPGAIEVQGDGVNNDCDADTDEDPQPACSSAAKFSGTTALDLVNAMDICPVAANGSWGIVGTPTITRASGSGSIDNLQVAVMTQFGTHASNIAIANATMASLSSGRARDSNDPDAPSSDTYQYYTGNPPADFSAPYGGGSNLPQSNPNCDNGAGANDATMLTVQVKVPTNALSFSFNFRFFSHEYWEYQCTEYNDFFIAMLYTGASGIPADKNISFDSNGRYISVNSEQFFTVCTSKEDGSGCGGTDYICSDGADALAGTGFDIWVDESGCDAVDHYTGGGTKWLSTVAPVVPGETITLKFVIWDTSDQALDSTVIIDNFKWSAQGTSGPSTFECWDLNKNGTCDIATEDQSGDDVCNERDC